MRTISQAAKLSGISVRTLQYYDEIGLLKPSAVTQSGYRLYDDEALQKLQQILFFKELGFPLKEISKILQMPGFDKIAAYKKQRELLLLKRNRTDRLIRLLDRLEKGEQCMSFKEFDLSDYIQALEDFKNHSAEEVIQHWGSLENFDLFIRKVQEDESAVAKLAIQQFGSIECYTEAMKYNLEHFSAIMQEQQLQNQDIIQKSDALYARLAANMQKTADSDETQSIVEEIIGFTQEQSSGTGTGADLWNMIIESYSNDLVKAVNDKKYGAGASGYFAEAFRHYFQHHKTNEN